MAAGGGAWVELGHQLRATGSPLDPGMSVSWVGSRMRLAGRGVRTCRAYTRSLAMLTAFGPDPWRRGLRRCRGRSAEWWCVASWLATPLPLP